MRTAWNNTKRHGKTRARQNKPDIPANKRMEERGKMSKEKVLKPLTEKDVVVLRLKMIDETIIGIIKQIEQGNAKGREDKELVSSEIVRANSKDLTFSQDSSAQDNQEQEAKKWEQKKKEKNLKIK